MKIAVIGCGYWGPNLVRNFSQLNKVDKLYCCDLDSKRLDRVTNLFPLVKGVRDYKELLEMPDLDGAVIATPVYSHFPLGQGISGAGKTCNGGKTPDPFLGKQSEFDQDG